MMVDQRSLEQVGLVAELIHASSSEREGRDLLYKLRDSSRPLMDLGRVAIDAVSPQISSDVIHFHLDPLVFEAPPEEREELVRFVAEQLSSGDRQSQARAAEIALYAIGRCDPTLQAPLAALVADLPSDTRVAVKILNAASSLKAIPSKLVHEKLDLLASRPDATSTDLGWVIAFHGGQRHFIYLEKAVGVSEEWRASIELFHAFILCRRFPELRRRLTDLYLGTRREARYGVEAHAARELSDARVSDEFLQDVRDGFEGPGPHLTALHMLKACVRPDQLRRIGSDQELTSEDKKHLWRAISTSTEGELRWATEESLQKEGALMVASRFGLLELRNWTLEAAASEQKSFLVSRHAEDAALWNIPDLLPRLGERLGKAGAEGAMWLVSDKATIVAGKPTLDAMLRSEGRSNPEEGAMSKYVDGLVYATIGAGDSGELTRALVEDAESWRRDAVAVAIRQLSGFDHAPAIDWDVIVHRIEREPKNWTSLELLIALSDADPVRAIALLRSLDPEERGDSRTALAAAIAGLNIEEAPSLERYLHPLSTARTGFEEQYAALALAHFRNTGLPDERCLNYLRNGLADELRHFLRGLGSPAKTERLSEALLDFVVDRAIESNNSWRSDGAYWDHLAGIAPERLLGSVLQNHVIEECGDHSVREYIDALVRHQTGMIPYADSVRGFLERVIVERDRAVVWRAATAAALLGLDVAPQLDGDKALRTRLELALWQGDKAWQEALIAAQGAEWLRTLSYAAKLDRLHEEIGWADQYWAIIRDSDDRLRDWRYAQALLRLPSERVYWQAMAWSTNNLQDGFFRRWILKNLDVKLKEREKLWRDSQLPGEDPSPRIT